MPNRKQSILQIFRIDPAIRKQLLAYKKATGMPLAMQINRALELWLSQQQEKEKR